MSRGLSPSPSPSPSPDDFPGSALLSKAADLWSSPRGTMYRIEFLVLLAAFAICCLATFGSHRRRRKNFFIQKGVLGVFILSTQLLTYILGSMQSSEVISFMYPVWAVSLCILYGCTNSITAYSLDDNTQQYRVMYQSVQYYAYVLFLLITVWPNDYGNQHPRQSIGTFILLFLCCTAINKSVHRMAACNLASSSWNLNKMVVDYMRDDDCRKDELVPSTMQGCHYLVDWPLTKTSSGAPAHTAWSKKDRDQVIDIERVWMCKDILVTPELKDACLSFSMFHLLRRRSFGFACRESKDWAPDIVFKGLLLENDQGAMDYDRVFKVIEVELAYMYDFLFTKYGALYHGSQTGTILWSLATIIFISYKAYQAFIPIFVYAAFLVPAHGVQGTYVHQGTFFHLQKDEVAVTLLLAASVVLLELLQLLFYWRTIWGRVSFVCQHLRGSSGCMMKLKELLIKTGVSGASNQHFWQHKLGQYSLLGSVSYSSKPFEEHPRSLLREYALTIVRSHGVPGHMFFTPRSYHAKTIRGKKEEPIEVHAKVKHALVHSLARSGGKLRNGESSLESNGAGPLKWPYEQRTHSDTSSVILIWHIATCYCEMAPAPKCPLPDGTDLKLHFDVAGQLSKYCAYLVVCAPKLLPGHHYDTTCVFDAAAIEAMRCLGGSKDNDDKYTSMKGLPASRETVFQRGVELGKQLVEEIEDVTRRWKVMADFWAETMLYVAPSDNVKEHMEQLANGGELITHLWALLSHAGILEIEGGTSSPWRRVNKMTPGFRSRPPN